MLAEYFGPRLHRPWSEHERCPRRQEVPRVSFSRTVSFCLSLSKRLLPSPLRGRSCRTERVHHTPWPILQRVLCQSAVSSEVVAGPSSRSCRRACSLRTGTPREVALSSFEPASSPATT